MQTRYRRWAGRAAAFGFLLTGAGIVAWAQPAPVKPAPEHGGHGNPEGWRFSWPAGDAAAGREVFVKLECYACHEVKGETFPAADPGKVGPELSFMAPLHPAEYFAEAVINPDAVVEEGKGYRSPDGKSKMPTYSDLVTVQEVVNLVAYLKALGGSGEGAPCCRALASSDSVSGQVSCRGNRAEA